MATERYFVGPNLLGDMRETIQRVAGMPTVEGGSLLPGIVTPMMQPSTDGFHLATFTGAWSINSSKTVTLYNAISTAETLSASNVLIPLAQMSDSTNEPTVCAIAEDRGTWYLLNVVHTDADVLTSVTLQPTRLEFGRNRLASINTTIATTAISITECDNESASAEQLNWFFG
jgi:hypothetical protein